MAKFAKSASFWNSTAAPHGGARVIRPLIPVVVSLLSGATLAVFYPGYIKTSVAGAAVLAILLVVRILRRGPALWLPLMFCLTSGYLSLQPWLAPVLPDDHIVHFADQGFCRIDGVVTDAPRPSAGGKGWRWVLSVEHISNPDGRHRTRGKVLVSARRLSFAPRKGDRLAITGRLRSPRNFMNPGGFDYKRYLGMKGIFCRIYGSEKHIRRMDMAARTGFDCQLNRLRSHLADCMDAALVHHEPACRALLMALILGDRSRIDSRLRDDFNRTGIGHLLAISGLHVGMVAGFAYAAAVWCLSWIPWITSSGWTRRGGVHDYTGTGSVLRRTGRYDARHPAGPFLWWLSFCRAVLSAGASIW